MTISNDARDRREAVRGNGTTGGQFGHQQHSAPGPGQFAAVPSASSRAAEHRYEAAMDQLRALDNLGEIADPARKAELTREAIAAAVAQARPGDTVVIAGKGHEQGQIVGCGEEMRVIPFDDVAVVRDAWQGVRGGSADGA